MMEIVLQSVETTLDPFDIYSIFKGEKDVSVLDSQRDHESLGMYSFIGINPFLVIKGKNDYCLINGVEYRYDGFDKLSEILKEYKVENKTDIPFIGGCIGYLSYDYGLTIEDISHSSLEDLKIPHYYFIFYDNLIIFDNVNKKTYVTSCGMLMEHSKSIGLLIERIKKQEKLGKYKVTESNAIFTSNFSKEEYIKTIGKMREYIRNGDIYIANLTQRFQSKTFKDAYEIYRDLRTVNPAPFAAVLHLEGFDIISSSPERFLKIYNNEVETRPIKGTRPRGKNEEEDAKNREELINSEKDRAELLMIVDLERNDLSKVCKPHSVKVTELFKIEEYSTVFHLVSTVKGELMDNVDSVQCLKSCFPGGSITGTPKIRAMEIIDELEGIKRGLYTGCIGYFSFDGNADFNIAIRTIIKKGNDVYFGVGGGITWDSSEEAEYLECLDKAKALMMVI